MGRSAEPPPLTPTMPRSATEKIGASGSRLDRRNLVGLARKVTACLEQMTSGVPWDRARVGRPIIGSSSVGRRLLARLVDWLFHAVAGLGLLFAGYASSPDKYPDSDPQKRFRRKRPEQPENPAVTSLHKKTDTRFDRSGAGRYLQPTPLLGGGRLYL